MLAWLESEIEGEGRDADSNLQSCDVVDSFGVVVSVDVGVGGCVCVCVCVCVKEVAVGDGAGDGDGVGKIDSDGSSCAVFSCVKFMRHS